MLNGYGMHNGYAYQGIHAADPLSATDPIEMDSVALDSQDHRQSTRAGLVLSLTAAGVERLCALLEHATSASAAGSSSTSQVIELQMDILQSQVLVDAARPEEALDVLVAACGAFGFTVEGQALVGDRAGALDLKATLSNPPSRPVDADGEAPLPLPIRRLSEAGSGPSRRRSESTPNDSGVRSMSDAEVGFAIERADLESRYGKKSVEELQAKLTEVVSKAAKLHEGGSSAAKRDKVLRQQAFIEEKIAMKLGVELPNTS